MNDEKRWPPMKIFRPDGRVARTRVNFWPFQIDLGLASGGIRSLFADHRLWTCGNGVWGRLGENARTAKQDTVEPKCVEPVA